MPAHTHRANPCGGSCMFEPRRALRSLLACVLALAALACAEEDPEPIGRNCTDPKGCKSKPQSLERIDAVDILLVVDNSGSADLAAFKEQLPRLINALVNGRDEDSSFPAASSVHVAVATS